MAGAGGGVSRWLVGGISPCVVGSRIMLPSSSKGGKDSRSNFGGQRSSAPQGSRNALLTPGLSSDAPTRRRYAELCPLSQRLPPYGFLTLRAKTPSFQFAE